MRGLVLYGANCTLDVWDTLKNKLTVHNVTFVEYPHNITEKANCVSDITKWIYTIHGSEKFDFILGHSMGGIIGLELVADFGLRCDKVVLVESNLKPAKNFYRNLMLPSNMEQYGKKIISMIKEEARYYNENLKKVLQEEFDYTDYIRKINSKIYGIYGDRGQRCYTNRISDLCIDDDIVAKIDFRFVEDSCHMPMIENHEALESIIESILAE
ncbi:alpha/beta hydrolase family protein [Oxobacter pfennigii]|uniref:Alpha/beta hydrolase family protein n=1 Tax=Oxobacter pfennigii TaxID=36849 RepID=A0A0P8W6Y9_9CLOT|nr:alpha/beta hydrolase [Oxobacter pfennigii]KPU44454.1 alpha/beta hydrolase family protein [Oxobacter pfennigii]